MNFKLFIENKKRFIIIVIILIVILCFFIFFSFQSQTVVQKTDDQQTTALNQQSSNLTQEDTSPDQSSQKSDSSKKDSSSKTKETDKNNQTKVSKNDSHTQQTSKNSSETITNKSSQKSTTSKSSSSTHKHVWKDHKAKKWVSHMVTVDDYETKTIKGARFYTYSGKNELGQPTYTANGPTYWFENGFTEKDLKNIMVTGIKNADENGLYNGVNYRNYQNVSKTEKVKVGSHQEDQGHYEEYVDYQYCSICGAKK